MKIDSASPHVRRRRQSEHGPVVAAWSTVDSLAEKLGMAGGSRSTSLITGLLDVFSIGVFGLVRRGLRSDEREEELLAELTRARRGIHRMEERDHELRNAVEGVRILVSLLHDDADPDEGGAGGRHVSAVTRSELGRIGQMLERGAEPGPIENYLVAPVVEAAVLAHATDVSVDLDMPPGLAARGCPTALTHVLSNLLGNCRRYAAGSAVRVCARRDRNGPVVEVCDDGARPGAEPAPPGVGIGLSVCRRLLRAEGARVEPPDLRPDGGCTVRVLLRDAQ